MERLTDPAQEKRKLLQAWVAEGENRNACESRVVISRESSNTYRGQKELVSIRDMFLVKKWPVEKIRGIVNRGGGIPDPDAPTVAALVQYWCTTSRTQTEEEAVRQKAETEIAAKTTASGLGSLMQLSSVPQGSGSVGQDQLDEIMRSTQPPASQGKGWALRTFHRACPVFLYGVLWVGWVGGSSGAVVIANLFVATRLVSWIA